MTERMFPLPVEGRHRAGAVSRFAEGGECCSGRTGDGDGVVAFSSADGDASASPAPARSATRNIVLPLESAMDNAPAPGLSGSADIVAMRFPPVPTSRPRPSVSALMPATGCSAWYTLTLPFPPMAAPSCPSEPENRYEPIAGPCRGDDDGAPAARSNQQGTAAVRLGLHPGDGCPAPEHANVPAAGQRGADLAVRAHHDELALTSGRKIRTIGLPEASTTSNGALTREPCCSNAAIFCSSAATCFDRLATCVSSDDVPGAWPVQGQGHHDDANHRPHAGPPLHEPDRRCPTNRSGAMQEGMPILVVEAQ